MTEPLAFDPNQMVAVIRDLDDDALAAGLRANGELMLAQVFARMPEYIHREHAGAFDAVIEWQVADPAGGERPLRWQLALKRGDVTLARDGDAEPTVTIALGGVDLLRLITGQVDGPRLFVSGRVRIGGDLMVAAQLPGLFRLPGAPPAR